MSSSSTPTDGGQITHSQLAHLLGETRGATILSLKWSGSDPARKKADRGRITKVSHYSGMVNPHYDRKKAKSLGIPTSEVEVSPTNWLDHVAGPVSRHNGGKAGQSNPKCGTLYVTFYPASGSTQYTLDGTPCEREAVADLVKPPSKGVVSNFRRITLTGVTEATIDKVRYDVVPD